MSKTMETAQTYWDARSELFSSYYIKPSLFDKIFRRGMYARIAISTKVCRDIPNATVLDIGSGPGINSVCLIKNAKVASLAGIDFAQQMVDFAIENAKREGVSDKCSFFLGDALSHDFHGEKFDFSMAMGVFDYIKGAQTLINRMSELTVKAFVISWPENGLRMWLRRRRYTCPLYHYTEEDIRALHVNAGIDPDKLQIIKIGGGWTTIAKK